MQTDILELFIEEIKQEFKDENWDYLTYVAERVREKQKEKGFTMMYTVQPTRREKK